MRAAREFASRELGLPDNKSYRSYADIGRPFVVWNVVAAPEFSVHPRRWCFPVAGCVAYRGYFHKARARDFALSLEAQGFDVALDGVPAYSTLGKFADPVLSSMLRYGDDQLAATIFHELAHQLLYVRDDSEFNEAFATTVEDAGLERWLAQQGAPQRMQRFRAAQADEAAFVALLARFRGELAGLYASGAAPAEMRERKAAILARLAADIRALERSQGGGYALYEEWIGEGLNNARLASVATYFDCVPGFRRLLAESGGDLAALLCGGARAGARAARGAPRAPVQLGGGAGRLGSAQRDQQHAVAAAHFQHQHRGALGALAQLAQARDLAAVRADDDVVGMQSGERGCAAGLDAAHQRAAGIGGIGQHRALEALVNDARAAAELGGGVGDHRGDLQRLAVAHQPDVDLVADAQQADAVAQLAVGLDRLAVDGGDHVAGADAGLVGGRALDHLRHQRAGARWRGRASGRCRR